MENHRKSDSAGTAYKATKLWNDVIAAFRDGVPRGKHRRYMRTAENCFVGYAAVDWLLDFLKKHTEFGSDVSRQQTAHLLNKFYKAGIFEEIQVSRRGRCRLDFSDSNRLYRLIPVSPTKSTRVPLADRSTNHLPPPVPPRDEKPGAKQRAQQVKKAEKGSKAEEAEPNFDVSKLPQCSLIGRFLTATEINRIWKTAVLSRLKKVLCVEGLEDILQDCVVEGGYVRHNCIFLNKSGIVTNIQPEDQLPHWVLSAMKCLARWPERVEGDLPSYPGFEKDVFGVVRDYFLNLAEPLITYQLYDVLINVFVAACNQLPRHSSPFSGKAGDRSGFCHSLWSDSSLENVILNLTRKYCLADSRADVHSLSHSRPDLFLTSDSCSGLFSHAEGHSCHRSRLAGSRGTLAGSEANLARGHDFSRLAKSHGELPYMRKRKAIYCPHSKSYTDLASSQGEGHPKNPGMGGSYVNLNSGRSFTNLHAAANSRCLAAASCSSLYSASGPLADGSCPPGDGASLRDSQRFQSSPDLQVTHYETAFGPENQTVTRVYYCDGVATDIHHSSPESERERSPWETHCDSSHHDYSRNRQPGNFHASSQAVNSPYDRQFNYVGSGRGNKSASSLPARAGSFQSRVQRSRSLNQLQQQQQAPSTAASFRPIAASRPVSLIQPDAYDVEQTRPASPVARCDRKPPPYRRVRTERYKTFAGTQLDFGEGSEARGLDHWEKEMSASMSYLPGLRLTVDQDRHHLSAARSTRSRQCVSEATSSTGRSYKRGSSLYLNLPQSGLHQERAMKALQVVCLFLPPAHRRKLHFLLKLMSKMAANPFLTLDPSQTTRSLVLGTFQHAVLRCEEGGDLDAVLVFQLVSFLMDHHMDVLAVPTDMKDAVEDRLRMLEKPQIVYSPRDPSTLHFARTVSQLQYEADTVNHSHNALVQLLDSIVTSERMTRQERRQRLKRFQKTYPQIYQSRFPDPASDPLQESRRPKIKPSILSKPLLKLKGLRV